MSGGGEPAQATSDPAMQEAPGLEDWPPRPWVLAAFLALAGLILHFLFDGNTPEPLYGAAAAFVFFGALSAAFALGPRRWIEAIGFALAVGVVMAGIAWQVLRYEQVWAGRPFAFAAGVFAVVISLPLFQAGFHRTRFATDYRLTHFHVWTDAISGAGALAFTGLSWLLLVLLDQLLGLVGITGIDWLFGQEWFGWMWSGGAFGAALGVLRNNLKVIGSLQHVVLLVLSLLAVPLALALLVFLVALLASGGQALWNATDAATPVLLACAVGCFVLANAIVRDGEDAISGNTVMRLTAIVLAAGLLPLAAFAAVSMGLRIGQHGLTPERIWAMIAVGVAVAYGLAYVIGMIRGKRPGWAAQVRQANLYLAAGTCVLALLLALPLVDFGAISARSQVARLEAGKVSAEDFDYTALRWDFGAAGQRALDRLATRGGVVGERATLAKAQTSRPSEWNRGLGQDGFTGTVRVQPANTELQARVNALLQAEPWRCSVYCVALDLGPQADGSRQIALVNSYGYEQLNLPADASLPPVPLPAVAPPAGQPLTATTRLELREETVRAIYVDGKRLGPPLD